MNLELFITKDILQYVRVLHTIKASETSLMDTYNLN